MPDDKPNAFEDLRKGLGLLFRAAKTTVEKLPTKDLEDAVVTSAREVGRAIENVGKTLEREVFGKKDAAPPTQTRIADDAAPRPADSSAPGEAKDAKGSDPKPPPAS
jgi:hypothetical protein